MSVATSVVCSAAAEPHSWRQAGAGLGTAAGTSSILFIFIFILPQCKINLTREIDEGASAQENFSANVHTDHPAGGFVHLVIEYLV